MYIQSQYTNQLSLTILGSSLYHFQGLHTEYSSVSKIENTTLKEDLSFKPFKISLYGETEQEYMTRPSRYIGTYYLLPLESYPSVVPLKLKGVIIHLPLSKDKWNDIRIVIESGDDTIFDVSYPIKLLEGKDSICLEKTVVI